MSADTSVRQGRTRSWTLRLRDAQGNPIEDTYDGSEALALTLWAGDARDAADLTTSTATWADPTLGTVTITLDGSDTAELDPGVHRATVDLTIDGETVEAWSGEFEILPAAGTDTPLATYCTLDDVRRVAPWVEELIRGDGSMQSDLAEQRHAARRWIDETLLARAARILERQHARHDPVLAVTPATITEGVDAGPAWGPSIYPEPSVAAQVEAIRDHLADDALMTADGAIPRIAALRTVVELCDAQIGRPGGGGDRQTDYQHLATVYRERARRALESYTARLDTVGFGDATLHLEP